MRFIAIPAAAVRVSTHSFAKTRSRCFFTVAGLEPPWNRLTHCKAHGTPFDLTRAAYHLGNRHVPIELKPDHLQIEPDHVLADMLRAMHLIVHETQAPFEPEAGAYGGHSAHSHGGDGHHDH